MFLQTLLFWPLYLVLACSYYLPLDVPSLLLINNKSEKPTIYRHSLRYDLPSRIISDLAEHSRSQERSIKPRKEGSNPLYHIIAPPSHSLPPLYSRIMAQSNANGSKHFSSLSPSSLLPSPSLCLPLLPVALIFSREFIPSYTAHYRRRVQYSRLRYG